MDLVMIQGRYQRLLNLSHNVHQDHLLAWSLLKSEVCDLSGFSDSLEFPLNSSYFCIAYYKSNRIEHMLEYLHLTWWEAEQIYKAIKIVEKQHSQLKSVAISELQDFTDKIIHTAQSRQAQAGVHQLSKAQRTRDIRQNKQEAIQVEREEHLQNRSVNSIRTIHPNQDNPPTPPSHSSNLDLTSQPDLMRQLFEEDDEE